MNREEILAMSRKENEGKQDERELAAIGAASKVGMLAGGLLCIVLVILSAVLFKTRAIGVVAWTVYFAMQGAHRITMFTKLKDRWQLVSGMIATFFAVAFLVVLCILC